MMFTESLSASKEPAAETAGATVIVYGHRRSCDRRHRQSCGHHRRQNCDRRRRSFGRRFHWSCAPRRRSFWRYRSIVARKIAMRPDIRGNPIGNSLNSFAQRNYS